LASNKIKFKISTPEDWKDKYLRAVAELENFRKRTAVEKAQIADNAKADIVTELLPLADSIASAMGMNIQAIEPLNLQLTDIFASLGITEIEALGTQFDPALHNAIMHEQDETKEANLITEEFQKGYQLEDKVIRHSLVKVVN